MKKTALEIYALLVCFGAIATLSINTGVAIYSIIGMTSPITTMDSYIYKRHQNNDLFWQHQSDDVALARDVEGQVIDAPPTGKKRPPEPELTSKRLESYQFSIDIEKRNNFQNLIIEVIAIIISIILFMTHWRFVPHKKGGLKTNTT